MGEILFKIHESYRWVVAICDKDIYGRMLVSPIRDDSGEPDDKRQLDLTGDFFKGEEMSDDQVRKGIIDCAKEDATFNIVGENSVRIAKEVGLVKDEGIIQIGDVPFALVLF